MQNTSTRTPFKFGYRVKESKEYPNGWKEIELSQIDITKPMVICLGGEAVTNTTYANGMAKYAERFLGVTPDNRFVNVYSIKYSTYDGHEAGYLNQDDIVKIARKLVLPLIIGDDHKRLSTEQASKNMRNINIWSNCYGQSVANRVINYTARVMGEYFDYSSDEVKQVLSQILQVTYAPIVKPNKYSTNLEFRSLLDNLSASRYEEEYFEHTKLTDIPFIGSGECHVEGNTIKYYVRSFEYEEKTTMDEHDMMILRDENWQAYSKRADTASQISAFVLSMGVLNSKENQKVSKFIPLPTTEEIAGLIYPTIQKANESYFELGERQSWEEKNDAQQR